MKKGETKRFTSSQTFTFDSTGVYKIEVYGAAGGSIYDWGNYGTAYGGNGGYAKGYRKFKKGESISVNCGSMGGVTYTYDDNRGNWGGSCSGGGSSSVVYSGVNILNGGGGGGASFSRSWGEESIYYHGGAGNGSYNASYVTSFNGDSPKAQSGVNTGGGYVVITLMRKINIMLGTKEVETVYLGTKEVDSIFLGSTEM